MAAAPESLVLPTDLAASSAASSSSGAAAPKRKRPSGAAQRKRRRALVAAEAAEEGEGENEDFGGAAAIHWALAPPRRRRAPDRYRQDTSRQTGTRHSRSDRRDRPRAAGAGGAGGIQGGGASSTSPSDSMHAVPKTTPNVLYRGGPDNVFGGFHSFETWKASKSPPSLLPSSSPSPPLPHEAGADEPCCLVLGCRTRLLACFGERQDVGSEQGCADEAHIICEPCLRHWFLAQNELRKDKGLPPLVRHYCPVCRTVLREASGRGSTEFCMGLRKVAGTFPAEDES